ncbi:MAG: polysaccharide deacetylase family protein [Bacilli bacterium]|nr:polysaccharide deacetylase family protein [Bacilli bacterium]
MKKKNRTTRNRIIALILMGLMLTLGINKHKKELFIKVENLYHKYFTEDNSIPIYDEDEVNLVETEIPIISNQPKEPIINETETLPIDNNSEEPTNNQMPIEVEEEPIIEPTPTAIEEESIVEPTPTEVENVEISEPESPNVEENEVIVEQTKKVAFTFDDGPSKYTKELLEILKENDAAATFFVLGSRIDNYNDTIEDIKDDGHQIGSHGVSHESFTELTNEELINELEQTKQLLSKYDITQTLVRPPYGNTNSQVKDNVDYPLIMWSVDTRDWEHRNSSEGTRIIIENIQDGSIILMHDLYKSTIETVRMVLPILKEQGYEFVTVDELFEDNELEEGKTYYKKIK